MRFDRGRPRGARALGLALAATFAAHVAGSPEALGGPPEQPRRAPAGVAWNPRWPKVRPAEYVAIAVLGGLGLGLNLALDGSPRWVGRNGFDDATRSALRWDSADARSRAGVVSDTLYYGLAAYPVLVDSLLLAKVVHGSDEVAWQTLLISVESLFANGVATTLAQGSAGRVRPLVEHCGDPANADASCGSRQENRSFWAGHVSTAFTGATLTCVHHARLPLLGGGAAEAVACAVPMLGAVTTGYLRVAADKHWASDVAIGAGVGALAGLVLPLSLHYGWSSERKSPSLRGVRLAPFAGRGAAGLEARGAF